jgi:competence protein ComEC
MNPRDLVAMGAALAAWWGAWCGTSGRLWWWVATGGLVLLLGVAHRWIPRVPPGPWRWRGEASRALAAAMAFAMLGGCAVGAARSIGVAQSPLTVAAQQRAQGATVVAVTGDPRSVRDGRAAVGPTGRCAVPVRVERFSSTGREVVVRTPAVLFGDTRWCTLIPGSRVVAVVKWSPAQDRDVAALGTVRGAPRLVQGAGVVQRGADRVRAALRSASSQAPFAGGALVPALVLGDESLMPEAVVDQMRSAGLSHLSAVSGANVAIVLGAVLLVARRFGARSVGLTVIGVVALLAFVLLARPEPSVLRAAVMGGVVLLAAWRGGATRPIGVLSAAVLVLVLLDPWLSRSPGFALSTAATAGLVVLVRRWSRPGARRITVLVLTTLAAQIAVAPIIAGLGGRIDVGGIIANVLAEPAVAPATILGLLAAGAALLHPALGQGLATLAALPAQWIVVVAQVVASRRWAWVPWPSGISGASLLGALLAAAAALVWVLRRHRSAGVRPRPSAGELGVRWGATTALGAIGLALVGFPVAAKTSWPAGNWRVVMCDVGQGDALVLTTGEHRAIVVDVGPDARQIDRCLRDLAVTRIDLLVLTHFHADHVNGLRGAMRGRRIERAMVSPLNEPEASAREVRALLGDRRVLVEAAVPGVAGRVGPWRLDVLAPVSLDPGEGSAPNNASVVIRAEREGRAVLLMGDAEIAEQHRMVTTVAPEALVVDVLKVAHHGSPVQDPTFMAVVAPRLALVPVGCRNRYGHPSPPLLRSFARAGIPVARSDRDGDVAVVEHDGAWRLVARGSMPTRGPSSRCPPPP